MSPPIEATVSFQCQEQISNQNTTSYLATARLMWLRPILAGRWLMKGPLRGEKETAGLGTVSHSDIFRIAGDAGWSLATRYRKGS